MAGVQARTRDVRTGWLVEYDLSREGLPGDPGTAAASLAADLG